MPDAVGTQTHLEGFLDIIWAGEGLVYLLTGRREAGSPRLVDRSQEQHWFQWPAQRDAVIRTIQTRRETHEVYFAPALFETKQASKEAIKGAHVFWCEFDGNVPDDLKGLPEPTVRVESSAGHEHWYWTVSSLVRIDVLEKVNRSLTYMFNADSSGWDATQVLRPPTTFNHKRSQVVALKSLIEVVLDPGLFDGLPEPPPLPELPIPDELPPVEQVVFRYKFPQDVEELFRSHQTAEMQTRSTSLMRLGYSFAEMNMTNEEMLALLMNADERWGKFVGRNDRLKRLMEIVTIARAKHPYKATPEQPVTLVGWKTLLATTVSVDWVWHGWLQTSGYMLMTGPQAIGKTQMSLYVGAHLALGKDVLGRVVKKPRKIAFLSLEMGVVDLKEFMMIQNVAYTPEEQALLEENIKIFPAGEPLYLGDKVIQSELEQFLGDQDFDGIFIDSMGSATEGDLSKGDIAKPLMDWQDRMRQRLKVFVWFVHHHRKATSDNKKPNKLDDVYGHYTLTARATSVFCMWPTNLPNAIEMLPLKVRLSARPEKFFVRRTPELGFVRVAGSAVENAKPPTDIEVVDEPVQDGKPDMRI